jgi:hypothetical protein
MGSKITPDQFPRRFRPDKSLVAIGVRMKRSWDPIEYRWPLRSRRRTVPGRVRPALAAFNGLQKLFGRLKPFGVFGEQKIRLRPRRESNFFFVTLSRTRLDRKIARYCPQTFGIEHQRPPYISLSCMIGFKGRAGSRPLAQKLVRRAGQKGCEGKTGHTEVRPGESTITVTIGFQRSASETSRPVHPQT